MSTKLQTLFKRLLGLALVGVLLGLLACTGLPPSARSVAAQKCVAQGGTWDSGHVRIPEGYCAKGTPAQCQAAGGRWERVCMMGTLACVKPYPDAHKACADGRECAGRRCLMAPGALPQTVPQVGRCIANDNPCYFGINLENGRPVPTAVAD
jgi:hypothetical protein